MLERNVGTPCTDISFQHVICIKSFQPHTASKTRTSLLRMRTREQLLQKVSEREPSENAMRLGLRRQFPSRCTQRRNPWPRPYFFRGFERLLGLGIRV